MATTKAYELGQLGGTLDVDSANNITLSGNLDAKYSGFDSDFTAKSTSDLSEGSNLYYTTTRFDTRLATKSTDDLSEGSNLYYTDARADARIAAATTADLTEGSNLYYTTARSDSDTGVYISGDRSYGNITTTGYIRGPSTFYIDPAPVDSDAGLLVIRGDLQVDGTTTTVNSTTVSINDKNIVLADSAANASEADGAGITVNGASATITYDASNDTWDFNKDINVTGTISSTQLINSGGTGTELAIVNDKAAGIGYYADNNGHTFKTYVGGWQTRLVVEEGGNVGIGTATVSRKLHVNGSARFDMSAGTIRISEQSSKVSVQATNNAETSFSDLKLDGSNVLIQTQSGGNVGIGVDPSSYSSYRAVIKRDNASSWPSPSTGGASGEAVLALINDNTSSFTYSNLVLRAGTGDCGIAAVYQNASNHSDLVFYTDAGVNGKEQMRLTHEGDVGIGVTNPSAALHVKARANQEPLTLGISSNGWGYITFQNETPSDVAYLGLGGGAAVTTGNYSDFAIRSNGNLLFGAGSNGERMRIGSTGNVGIGTTSPIEELDVDGTIRSGSTSKPINATYSSGGNMNSFEHRFNRVKNGAGSPHVLVDIQFTSNFHQAMFVIEYGARLQAVSDSVTNAVIRSFGVNRFNGGNCNITETNNTHLNSNVSSHAPIYINVVSQTRYQIVVNFSGTLGGSSFVSGSIRGYGVNSEFPTISFSDGLNGF